jgi:hypothetical protein
MNKYIALPTWLIVMIVLPFIPTDHPWKGRRFTLEEWFEGRTTYTKLFDFSYWCSSGIIIGLLIR